jgi:hypothetical protein
MNRGQQAANHRDGQERRHGGDPAVYQDELAPVKISVRRLGDKEVWLVE